MSLYSLTRVLDHSEQSQHLGCVFLCACDLGLLRAYSMSGCRLVADAADRTYRQKDTREVYTDFDGDAKDRPQLQTGEGDA